MAMTPADKEILKDFERTRQKTIDLLKAVPPGLLKKKAKGEETTLAGLFSHISLAVNGWMFRCMKDSGPQPQWPAPKSELNKAALLKSMRASQKRLLKFFEAKGGAAMSAVYEREREGKKYRFVGRNRVLYLTQHEVHHRGKIVLALRQWGFTKIPFLPF